MDHNNDNAVFWDDKGFYTVRWEDTGNNEIPHKKYIYKPDSSIYPKLAQENERIRVTRAIELANLRDWINLQIVTCKPRYEEYEQALEDVLQEMDELGL